jgi:hypothetical protein
MMAGTMEAMLTSVGHGASGQGRAGRLADARLTAGTMEPWVID